MRIVYAYAIPDALTETLFLDPSPDLLARSPELADYHMLGPVEDDEPGALLANALAWIGQTATY